METKESSSTRGTLYWIEDDADVLYPCMEPLQKKGYHIEVIETMREALDRYDDLAKCRLVIIDLLIRHVDPTHDDTEEPAGIDLIRQLLARGLSTPIIVITIIFNNKIEKDLRNMGISQILNKPVHPHRIVDVVENVLSSRQK